LVPEYMSISSLDVADQEFTLTVDTEDFADVGTQTFYLHASYEMYPNL
jgi:hypothetical protein